MRRFKHCLPFLLLMLFSSGILLAQQQVSTKGKVLSDEGVRLENTTITVVEVKKSSTMRVLSDSIGNFVIRGLTVGVKYNLFFTHVGYEKDSLMNLSFSATENSSLLIRMKRSSSATLSDVVVTALGIKRSEKALSYSAQQISASELSRNKDANFVNSLSGKVAGVTINTSSSGVGGATKVVMRGVKSIAKGNNALYVVDGVPMFNSVGGQGTGRFASTGSSEGIADINPDDIESLTVLTGASAAALYGAEAANGVVLITTKQGKAGKLSVNFSSQADFLTPFVLPQFQDKYGNRPGEIKSWGDTLPAGHEAYEPSRFFNTGKSMINSLSLSTGNAQNQTFFSASTTQANGIVPNNSYDRYNLTIRNTAKFLNDKMFLDLGANYIRQDDKNMRNQGEYFNPIVPVYLFPRGEDFTAVRAFERFDEGRKISLPNWPFGEGGFNMQNPYWVAYRNVISSNKDRYILSGSLKYNLLDWLSVSTRARFDNTIDKAYDKRYAGTLLMFTGNSDKGFYSYNTSIQKQMYVDGMLSANKTLGDYSISANAGAIFSDLVVNAEGFRAPLREDGISNFFSPYNQRFTGQDANPMASYNGVRTYSAFFSGEFGWKRMLYATVTGRNDWASQLVNTNHQSFFYPSVGLSAIVSQMVDLPKAISFLKLRSSLASVGNPPQAGLTSPTYTYNAQTGTWMPNSYMPISELFPEKTISSEFGLSAKFFRNKLSLDATLYQSNTYKQTFNPAITPTSGYTSMYLQTGNIENKGIEAILGYKDSYFKDFEWDTKLTFTANRNKIVELADDYVDPNTGEHKTISELRMAGVADAQFILRKGGTLGDVYSTTDVLRDENGRIFTSPSTGKISPKNNNENFLGSVFPNFNMGWNNEFSYKGASLGFLLSGRFGGVVLSSTQAVLDNFGVSKVSGKVRDNGGVKVNNGIVSAQDWFDVVAAGQGMMAYYTYDATNIRLQEAHINYAIPQKYLGFKVSLGVNARNLFMIYNKAPFDPESTASTGNFYQGLDYFMMPSLRNIGFNIKLQF